MSTDISVDTDGLRQCAYLLGEAYHALGWAPVTMAPTATSPQEVGRTAIAQEALRAIDTWAAHAVAVLELFQKETEGLASACQHTALVYETSDLFAEVGDR